MKTIITTTGISLFFNTKRKYGAAPTEDQMRNYLHAEPQTASAEANSLLQFAEPDDTIVLLHTEKPEAKLCVNILKDFFNHRGFKNIRVVELQFQEDERHIETHGLRNLVETLIVEVDKAQRQQQKVIINATAGFKAQIVYSTMIGMLYQVPVKYMYENFHRVITFDPIPLDWDTSLFLSYQPFFQWIDDDVRQYYDVENRLQSIPERDRIRILTFLTVPNDKEEVFLSPIGNALQGKFKQQIEEAKEMPWPPPVNIVDIKTKISHSLLKSKHHMIKKLLPACFKVAALPYVKEITGSHFEPTTETRLKIYPDGTIQLLWGDSTKAQIVRIYTTAQGHAQTLKVAEKIREILEID